MFSGEQSIRSMAPSPTALSSRFISETAAAISSGVIFLTPVIVFRQPRQSEASLPVRSETQRLAMGRSCVAQGDLESARPSRRDGSRFPGLVAPARRFLFHFCFHVHGFRGSNVPMRPAWLPQVLLKSAWRLLSAPDRPCRSCDRLEFVKARDR